MKIHHLLMTLIFILAGTDLGQGFTLITFAPEKASLEKTIDNAINSPQLPSTGAMNGVLGIAGNVRGSHASRDGNSGLQFNAPVLSPRYTYSTHNDESPGGFDGNEHSASLSLDADIYNGWIAGLLYQHSYRAAKNNLGADQHLEAGAASGYLTKRFWNLMNTGIAYNFADSNHHLSRSVTVNLDSASHGFTFFTGASDRMGHWSWNTTVSYGYADVNYKEFTDTAIGRFGWNGGVHYDASKFLTVGMGVGYYNFVLQEQITSGSQSDDDYCTIGPRLTVHPHERIDWHIDFESVQGLRDVSSFALTTGIDILF